MSSIKFTAEEIAAFRQEYAKGATDSQFTLFISECERRGLRPGAHLVFQLRNAKEYDPTVGASIFVKKPYWITTISALLLIAERTGKYDGASAPEYIYLDNEGTPSVVSEIPLPDKNNLSAPREPWAVRVKIRRKDFSEPIVSIVRFDSVAATMKRDNGIVLTEMWQKRPGEQCAKCALANGIRIGFPEEAGHLFLSEEIKSEEEEKVSPAEISPAVAVPVPPPAPAVNQTPAVATNEPRPGEHSNKPRTATGQEPGAPQVDVAVPTQVDPAPEPAKTPAKRGRKPKPETGPETGPKAVDQGITEEDVSVLDGQPKPEAEKFDHEANQKEAKAFVEEATSFTKEEAVAQGLPEPVDPVPSKEQSAGFVARMRALVGGGVDVKSLGDYTLTLGNKASSKALTIGDWTKALTNLEAAKADGKLKELVTGKEVPLGTF